MSGAVRRDLSYSALIMQLLVELSFPTVVYLANGIERVPLPFTRRRTIVKGRFKKCHVHLIEVDA